MRKARARAMLDAVIGKAAFPVAAFACRPIGRQVGAAEAAAGPDVKIGLPTQPYFADPAAADQAQPDFRGRPDA